MVAAIPDQSFTEGQIRAIMRLIRMWNNSGFQDFAKYCISWVEVTMDCEREAWHRYLTAGAALCALDDHPSFSKAVGFISPRDDAYAEIALRYLSLYRYAQDLDDEIDPSPACPAAAIVALQIIRAECSDSERPTPKKRILGAPLVHALTWVAKNTPDNPVHFRPLALEIFTLIGGMWFDPWVDSIPQEDKTQFISALGNVLDAPNLTPENRDPLIPWPPGEGIDNYQEMFEGRTGSFVYRSPIVYLIPLLFGLCSSKSWQGSLKRSTFDFISHKTFRPDCWTMWLRHTWKLMARDSRLDIRLIAIKLKELERYDVLALVIRSIWLSPDPDMLLPHHWEWVEEETLGLFRVQRGPAWRPLEGYFPIIIRTYHTLSSGDPYNPPGAAVRRIFQYDRQMDSLILEELEPMGQLAIKNYHFEMERPQDWRIRQVCMMKRLFQVLTREISLEGLHMFRKWRENKVQGGEVALSPDNLLFFTCDYPY